ELLVREKAHTRAGDELAAARRRLPMTRMEPVMVVGPDGPVPLHDVFEGRRMLIVYHFMWNKGAPHHRQCEGCTHSQTAMNSAVARPHSVRPAGDVGGFTRRMAAGPGRVVVAA